MKISEELEDYEGYMRFEELREGDVFVCPDAPGKVFMKIEFTPVVNDDAISAVQLTNGKTHCFFDDDRALPVKTVLELA